MQIEMKEEKDTGTNASEKSSRREIEANAIFLGVSMMVSTFHVSRTCSTTDSTSDERK